MDPDYRVITRRDCIYIYIYIYYYYLNILFSPDCFCYKHRINLWHDGWNMGLSVKRTWAGLNIKLLYPLAVGSVDVKSYCPPKSYWPKFFFIALRNTIFGNTNWMMQVWPLFILPAVIYFHAFSQFMPDNVAAGIVWGSHAVCRSHWRSRLHFENDGWCRRVCIQLQLVIHCI